MKRSFYRHVGSLPVRLTDAVLILLFALTLGAAACSPTYAPSRPDGGGSSNRSDDDDDNDDDDDGEGGAGGAGGLAGAGGSAGAAMTDAELAELAGEAENVLRLFCSYACHDADTVPGGNAKGEFGNVLDVQGMINVCLVDPNEECLIVPFDASRSLLWNRMKSGSMPRTRISLVNSQYYTDKDGLVIEAWINAGAPDWKDYR